MALIKCDECGYWCSSDDDSCPNCGNPINPPKPPKNNGKQGLYIISAIVVIVAFTSILALMYNDVTKREHETMLKAEMLAKELREKKRADSISALQAHEEAIRKAQEDSIEAALAYEEQQRVEEEERVRREGVQKTIRINCTIAGRYEISDYSSNVKCYIFDTWRPRISTYILRAPKGKIWLYKGFRRSEGMEKTWRNGTILQYFTKENEGWIDRGGHHYHYDKEIDLEHGDVPVIRPGDGIAIMQGFDDRNPGEYWVEVYLVEKNEEDYY